MTKPKLKLKKDLLFYTLTLIILIYRLAICVSYKPELSVGETNNIWNALSVANGKSVYSNPAVKPFEIFQYTPISQIPVIIASYVSDNESLDYYYHVMVIGRLLSLLFNVLTFILVYKIMLEQLKIIKEFAKWAALFGFCILTHLSFSIRPDAMAIFLSVASIYLFGKAYFNETYRSYILSGVFLSLSFYTKQDAPLIISALGLILLIQKKIKSLIVFSTAFCVSLLSISFINYLLFGEYFFNSILGGIDNGMSISRAQEVFERYTHFYGALFFVAVFSIFYIIKSKMLRTIKIYLVTINILSLLIAFFSSSKMGSWINYFTLVNIVSIVTIFYCINYLTKEENKRTILNPLKYTLTILLSYFIFQQAFHYTAPFLKYYQSKKNHYKILTQFKPFKDSLIDNQSSVYSSIPEIKLFLFRNIILPNSEFYPVSTFSTKGYNKLNKNERLSFLILPEPYEDDLKGSPFDCFNINTSEFKVKEHIMNYTILENGND